MEKNRGEFIWIGQEKMKNLLILLSVTLLLLAACEPNQTHFPTIEDEYAIYSAVFEYRYFGGNPILLVNEKFITPKAKYTNQIFDTLSLMVPEFNQKGWKNYIELDELKIENNFKQMKYELVLLDYEEVKSISELSDKYPKSDGYIMFSKVAYHPYREEAIVVMSDGIDPRSQQTDVFLLEKINGKWVVIGGGTYMIS